MTRNKSAALAAAALLRTFRTENRNGKMELRAVPDFALHPESPAVRFHQMFRNRQSQAGASDFARARDVDAIKPFKDSWLVCYGNPDARIGNREDYFRVTGFRADHDLSAGWRVLNRAVDQTLQHFSQSPAIARNFRQFLSKIHGQPQILLDRARMRRFHAPCHELLRRQTPQFKPDPARIHL